MLREQVSFPPYGIVLCDLENDEHNVELTFITEEEGNTSLVLLWLCKFKLEIVYFFIIKKKSYQFIQGFLKIKQNKTKC